MGKKVSLSCRDTRFHTELRTEEMEDRHDCTRAAEPIDRESKN